jgi:hypothetical protein
METQVKDRPAFGAGPVFFISGLLVLTSAPDHRFGREPPPGGLRRHNSRPA